MCTVTFIPGTDRCWITHNRDEKSTRSKALSPAVYNVNGHTLLFPRDSAAGGTWIAAGRAGQAGVLLNGAFVPHACRPPYRKSRGLAFLDIMAAADVLLSYQRVQLEGIEPFTVILYYEGLLHECRWDGTQKHIQLLDPSKAHTWSSVTLYNEAVRRDRNGWFSEWLIRQSNPSTEDIIQYHLQTGAGDPANQLRMNRDGQLLTVSLSSMELTADACNMQYIDLADGHRTTRTLLFSKSIVVS